MKSVKIFLFSYGFVIFGLLAFVIGIMTTDNLTLWTGGVVTGLLLVILGIWNLRKVRQVRNKPKVVTSSVAIQIKNVATNLELNQYEEALGKANTLLSSGKLNNKGVLKIKSMRARCYYHLDQFDKAHADLSEVVNSSLIKAGLDDFSFKILCETELGRKNEANSTLQQALKLFPNDPKLIQLLHS